MSARPRTGTLISAMLLLLRTCSFTTHHPRTAASPGIRTACAVAFIPERLGIDGARLGIDGATKFARMPLRWAVQAAPPDHEPRQKRTRTSSAMLGSLPGATPDDME